MKSFWKYSLIISLPILVSCTSNCTGGSGGSDDDNGGEDTSRDQTTALSLDELVQDFEPNFMNTASRSEIIAFTKNIREHPNFLSINAISDFVGPVNRDDYEVGSNCGLSKISGLIPADPSASMGALVSISESKRLGDDKIIDVNKTYSAIATEEDQGTELTYFGLNQESGKLLIVTQKIQSGGVDVDLRLIEVPNFDDYELKTRSLNYDDENKLERKDNYTLSFRLNYDNVPTKYEVNLSSEKYSSSFNPDDLDTLEMRIENDPESTGSLGEDEISLRISTKNLNVFEELAVNEIDFYAIGNMDTLRCKISRVISKK